MPGPSNDRRCSAHIADACECLSPAPRPRREPLNPTVRLRYSGLRLNDLDQFPDAFLIRMLLRQSGADTRNDAGVMLWSRHHVQDFLVRVFPRHHQLGGALSIELLYVGLIHSKQWNSVCGDRLEGTAGHEAKMVEQRAVDDRHENTLAHVFNYRTEHDRRERLDLQLPQILRIRIVCVLD